MTLSQLTIDIAYIGITTLGDAVVFLAGALTVLAILDATVSIVQVIRK